MREADREGKRSRDLMRDMLSIMPTKVDEFANRFARDARKHRLRGEVLSLPPSTGG